MAAKKITEQQFHARKRDRRMVWVDATAAVVGMLLISVSVGGVLVLEEEPEPFEWSASIFEGKITQKRCAGGDAGRVGCKYVYLGAPTEENKLRISKQAPEGHEIVAGFEPVTFPNVTRVTFALSWIDDLPDDYDQKSYPYDENATDILLLRVVSPWGEEKIIEGANAVPVSDDALPTGSLKVEFNATPPPEVGKVSAFTQKEAQAQLAAEHTVTEHDALGDWQAYVTVQRAGDINGTAPANACEGEVADRPYETPDEVDQAAHDTGYGFYYDGACNLEDDQGSVEDNDAYPAVERTGHYEPTHIDEGNEWVLEMVVWTYSTTVSL